MTALFEYRKKVGLTQAALANQLGVAQNVISQWETGERKPDIIKLKKLARVLNCTTDELLEPIEI